MQQLEIERNLVENPAQRSVAPPVKKDNMFVAIIFIIFVGISFKCVIVMILRN